MGTKGPSNLYGNTKGSPTKHINYPYAKEFNKSTLLNHMRHANSVKAVSTIEYEKRSIEFANEVNLFNKSFVITKQSAKSNEHYKIGWTYKYNPSTGEFGIINQRGKVISYFKPRNPVNYWNNVKKEYDDE